MPLDQSITLTVLALMLVALVFEWVPVGMVGILAPLILVLTGVLDSREMWSGLAQPAVVAVGAMFVVSAAVSRTGALTFLGDALSSLGRYNDRRTVLAMLLVVALLSAFINNTTVVLVFIPVVLAMCERLERAPSRYLIPLSFASMFGGMVTLIGTSTNIVVAEAGERALEQAVDRLGVDPERFSFAPGMWSFAPMGLVFLGAGVLYMMTLGRRLLPRRRGVTVPLERGMPTEYVTEVEILPESSLAGKTVSDLSSRFSQLRVLQVIRNDVVLPPSKDLEIEFRDILLVKGRAGAIVDLGSGTGASLMPDIDQDDVATRTLDATLAEVIVPPGSRWIGRAVKEIRFRDRYGVSVIAVQRHGQHIRQKVGELRVEPADMILLQGTVESLRKLRASDNLFLMEGVGKDVKLRSKAPVALGGLAFFVLLISSGWFDIATSAVAASTLLVLSRCITLQEAFDSVDWNILFILAGSLVIGGAVNKVGLDREVATSVEGLLNTASPMLIVAIIYGLTAFLTDFISNGAAAALMIPIVVQASIQLGDRPEPYLMSVAFGASSAFLTPVGYQTNLLVYAPGGYRFRDYMIVGLPLRIIFWILAAVFIPRFYSF